MKNRHHQVSRVGLGQTLTQRQEHRFKPFTIDASLVKGLSDLVNLGVRLSQQADRPELLGQLWNSAHLRMTSYEKDKTLCLPALLELDLARLQVIEDEEKEG